MSEESPTQGRGPAGSRSGKPGARKDKSAKKVHKHPRLRKVVKWFSIAMTLFIIAGIVGFVVLYQSISIPNPNSAYLTQTTHVYYSDGKHQIGTFETQNRQSVPLSQVPTHLQNAVIAAEDRTFYSNSGIDFRGIFRAVLNNSSGGNTQGASTITQQYVKVLYLTQQRTWTRKIKEAILALKIDHQESKQEILQGYLNTIYFGRGAYGVQAAAQAYFGVNVEQLTVAQSAALAAILNSPGTYDPANGKAARAALVSRYDYVLSGMASMGNLNPARAARVGKHLPKFPQIKPVQQFGGEKGYLLKLVQAQLEAQGFTDAQINGGGLRVVTTFDYKDQQAAMHAVRTQRPTIAAKGVHIGISAVQPGTGALRAMYGGPNFLKSEINWAMTGRQPGSSFKPFALAAALKQGTTLQDTFTGDTLTLPGGAVVGNEFGYSYGSAISLLTATEVSSNTAYVDMVQHLTNGPQSVVNAAIAAGIPKSSPALDAVPVVPLGVANVRPVDMADGYATFAANGQHAPWYVIERVTDPNGQTLYDHKVKTDQAFSPAIASNVNYALQQVVQSTSGTGGAAQAIGCPVAGKTGTAALRPNTVTSAWFVGYTPKLAAAVMYVKGDGTQNLDGTGGLSTFFGANYPADTFTSFMQGAGQGSGCVSFPQLKPINGTIGTPYTPPPTTPPTTTPTTTPPTTTPTTTPPTTTPPTTTPPTTTPPTTTPPTTTPTTVPTP
ncbi:MAG: transglycosylase domain-containing protein [Nocardioidaceae bacterium]